MWEKTYQELRYIVAFIIFIEINFITASVASSFNKPQVESLTNCPATLAPVVPASSATVQDVTEQCLAWMLDTNFIEAKKRICNTPTK